jgi:hypothetical protein
VRRRLNERRGTHLQAALGGTPAAAAPLAAVHRAAGVFAVAAAGRRCKAALVRRRWWDAACKRVPGCRCCAADATAKNGCGESCRVEAALLLCGGAEAFSELLCDHCRLLNGRSAAGVLLLLLQPGREQQAASGALRSRWGDRAVEREAAVRGVSLLRLLRSVIALQATDGPPASLSFRFRLEDRDLGRSSGRAGLKTRGAAESGYDAVHPPANKRPSGETRQLRPAFDRSRRVLVTTRYFALKPHAKVPMRQHRALFGELGP